MIYDLDWNSILFLIGIFIVIGAISKVGLLTNFASFLSGAIGGNLTPFGASTNVISIGILKNRE